ncbi:MAG: C40 family peptidase [Mycobacterium sp.]|nr:C40 family peptidase [Mycobacterium sp.]
MAVTGYWVLGAEGSLAAHGRTPQLAGRLGPAVPVDPADPVVGMATTPNGRGYWTVTGRGVVRALGNARPLGEPGPNQLDAPVVAITATPDGTGYWLLTSKGKVLPFGTAAVLPRASSQKPTKALGDASAAVGLAVTPTGKGYWIVHADGRVKAFGDAARHVKPVPGSPATGAPTVAIAATPDGLGYWTVASDGVVQAFGTARTFSPLPNQPTLGRVRALTSTPDGQGYWLLGAGGRVAAFGAAARFPKAPNAPKISTAVALTVPVRTPLGDVPMQWIRLDQRAAATCTSLPWTVLAAIGKVESDFGRSSLPGVQSGTNLAGAAGPMQIGIGGLAGDTWARYDHPVAADPAPNPPDAANPPNPWDRVSAVYAAARLLCTAGGGHPETLRAAVLAYNHVDSYADQVLALSDLYAGTATGTGAAAVRLAETQLGVTYVFGAESPGSAFDCSGLTQWTFRSLGVPIPRTAAEQWAALPHLPAGVPWQPGDLVFFVGSDGTRLAPGHVGIYIGNGEMIDAPHTGAVVRIDPVWLNDLVGVARPPLPATPSTAIGAAAAATH